MGLKGLEHRFVFDSQSLGFASGVRVQASFFCVFRGHFAASGFRVRSCNCFRIQGPQLKADPMHGYIPASLIHGAFQGIPTSGHHSLGDYLLP